MNVCSVLSSCLHVLNIVYDWPDEVHLLFGWTKAFKHVYNPLFVCKYITS